MATHCQGLRLISQIDHRSEKYEFNLFNSSFDSKCEGKVANDFFTTT